MFHVTLPWPARQLSPNSRSYFRLKAEVARASRLEAKVLSLNALNGHAPFAKDDRLSLSLEFCPPDNKKRDMDNMLASCKAALDGVFDALAPANDRQVRQINMRLLPPVKDGQVVIELERMKP